MPPNATDKKQELEISDIRQKYPQQWVTVDITQRDKYGLPLLGRVILHSKTKKDLVDKIENTEGELYVFYSGSIDDDAD
ncbi:hypothetical protein [Argonema galeatum]|uniref:hypothetical protein n=1 Tax=Argonema galeatum TaxID=2942762 RepID=UPI002013400C|nr:hypothetical protein [Argonema galeatum]MCL1465537.1 hypothetical protein [Argonema galeatum A003/A1]